MSHNPFLNNNGHNISEDFLNLALSLEAWSWWLPASDAPSLSGPSSSIATSNSSSVIPPFSYPYELDPTLHQAVEGPSYHQRTEVGGPSQHQNMATGDPSNHQGMVPRGPAPRQRVAAGGPIRNRHPIRRILRPGQSETITPPYPWATEYRAIIHDLQYLRSEGINTITGKVRCMQCNADFDIEYDLQTKFQEVQHYVIANKDTMWQRAPGVWRSPAQLDCQICDRKKCVKPISGKKRSINWLFLLLGQMIGFCKHTELKYFCKHTGQHKTGAKDRVLYLTYMELCKQLDPLGDYDP